MRTATGHTSVATHRVRWGVPPVGSDLAAAPVGYVLGVVVLPIPGAGLAPAALLAASSCSIAARCSGVSFESSLSTKCFCTPG